MLFFERGAHVTEADISIHSVIENLDDSGLACGDAERTHVEARGALSVTDGFVRAVWRESSDGGTVDSELLVEGDTVTVSRRGAIESTLVFKEGHTASSVYRISPYSFDSHLTARRVRVALNDSCVGVTVIYDMEIGGARKLVKMKFKAESCESSEVEYGA